MKAQNRTHLIALALAIVFAVVGMVTPTAAFAKKLLISVGQEPTEFDLNLASSGPSQIIAENWGEWLVQKNPDGELVPGLATSWEYSDDAKEVVFTLRKGVKFHSGDDFTAEDVKFSFDRGFKKNRVVKSRLRSVEKYEVIDDYHFKVYLKFPDATIIPNRTAVGIVSKAYIERVGEEVSLLKPVGTGPYKVVGIKSGEYIDLERFDGYWGPKPSVKEARILFTPEDTTRVAKLMAGEVDLIKNVPWALMDKINKTKGFKLVTLSTGHPTRALIFATKNPKVIWHDPKIRLAMAYAIDRESIVRDLLNGVPDNFGYIAPGQIGYDPAVKTWPYDPDKAKKLLAEAGYPDGFEFNFYWPISGRVPMTSEVVQAIAAQLSIVGIRAKLVGEEYAAFRKRRKAAKKPDAVFVGYFSGSLTGAPHPGYYLDLYFSAKGAFSIYDNPEITRLAAESRAELDDKKCAEIVKKAVKIMYKDVPTIPIFNSVAVYAMKDNIDYKPTKNHNFDLMLIKDVTMK